MTWKKYRRLLLVLSVPLLLVGWIFFSTVVPAPTYASIVCTQPLPTSENCRTTDGLGKPFDEAIRAEYRGWFDVDVDRHKRNNFPVSFVSASERIVERAVILEVTPYAGAALGAGSGIDRLSSRVGEEISIVLGVEPNQSRDGYLRVLGCNELRFDASSSSFTAGLCGLPDGLASVRFSTDDQSLSRLESAVRAEMASARGDLILHYLIGVPSFLLMFLILSGLAWMIRRAWLYVAAA